LHKVGAIGHYVFVSAKTEDGMDELRNAIFDCNIDIGPRFITPSAKMVPTVRKPKPTKKAAQKAKEIE